MTRLLREYLERTSKEEIIPGYLEIDAELTRLEEEELKLQAKLKQKDAVIAELSKIKTDYTEFLHFIEYNSGCGDIVGCASFNRKRLVKFLSKIKQIQSEQDDGNE